MAFDRFNEKPPRRERRFGDRQNFGERFGDRGAERPFDRFSGRGERQQFDRRDHRDYEGRPAFGDRPRFSGKPGFKRFEGQGPSRFDSATRSGPLPVHSGAVRRKIIDKFHRIPVVKGL